MFVIGESVWYFELFVVWKELSMKNGFVVAVLIPLLFAVGCTQNKQVKVTYRSDPPGGTLYRLDGELWGPCPKVLWYDLDKEAIANGYVDARGLMVRWPSGPEKASGKLIRITVDGTDRQVTFVQPGGPLDSAASRAGTGAGQ